MELAAAVSAWSGKEPTVIPSVRQAVRAAVAAASARDMVLVTGSFYTVGEAPIEWLISMGCAAGSHAHQ
jgi:folylpolyglutamate synthase/dihydropteroate synthase